MKRKIIFLLLTITCFNTNADTPGKQPMHESKVIIKNIAANSEYDLYWKGEYDSAIVITKDTTFIIPSSGGAPYHATLWAVNKTSKTSTDSLSFENYYAPDYEVTLDTIRNNILRHSKREISNNNAGGVTGDNNITKSKSTNLVLFTSVSLIALLLLVLLFKRKKNRSNTAAS